MKKILLIALLSSLVMGCGSDSDSSNDSNYTPAVPPTGGTDNNQGGSTQNIISKGFYEGTTTQGQDVIGLVSDSNELWFLYSEAYKNSIGGFIKGNINPSKDTTKFNVNDYNISTSTNYKATLSNKVNANKGISGNIDYGRSDIVDFNLNITSDGSLGIEPIDPVTKNFKGNVGITGVGVETANINIGMDGKVLGTGASGCKISGDVSYSNAKNYSNVRINFGGSPCALANTTFKGVGYHQIKERKLVVSAVDTSGQYGLVFAGDVTAETVDDFFDIIIGDITGSPLSNELSKPIEKI